MSCIKCNNIAHFRVCLLPDERSERKCTQNGDTFAELNPSFCENCVFQVSTCNTIIKQYISGKLALHIAIHLKKRYFLNWFNLTFTILSKILSKNSSNNLITLRLIWYYGEHAFSFKNIVQAQPINYSFTMHIRRLSLWVVHYE